VSAEQTNGAQDTPRLLYCHCAYAKVVPAAVKDEVLRKLGDSGVAFDAVPDLCEMSARKDPALERIAGDGNLRIVACYPRAVRWLFHAGGKDLAETGVEVLNMREDKASTIVERALAAGPVVREVEPDPDPEPDAEPDAEHDAGASAAEQPDAVAAEPDTIAAEEETA